jgi:hypothetical protein
MEIHVIASSAGVSAYIAHATIPAGRISLRQDLPLTKGLHPEARVLTGVSPIAQASPHLFPSHPIFWVSLFGQKKSKATRDTTHVPYWTLLALLPGEILSGPDLSKRLS